MTDAAKPSQITVLVADVTGHIHQAATRPKVAEYHRVLSAEVARYGGRIVNKHADRYQVEFSSPVRAVSCALDIHRKLELRGATAHADKIVENAISVLMGIDHGDVVAAGAVADWLMCDAPVDSICISDGVYDTCRDRVFADGVDLGERVRPTDEGGARQRVIAIRPASEPLGDCRPGMRAPDDMEFRPQPAQSAEPDAPAPTPVSAPAKRNPRWLLAMGNAAIIVALVAAFQLADRLGTPSAAPADDTPNISTRGGTLQVGWSAEPGAYAVYADGDTLAHAAMEIVLEPLVRVSDSGRVEPAVIKSWRAREGGRALELRVRSGVMFHANPCLTGGVARAADAADVVWSLEVARRRGVLPERYQSFEAAGESRVNVYLNSPGPYVLFDLTSVMLLPNGIEICETESGVGWPVGTGPFRFAEPPSGATVELRRAAGYWQTDREGLALPYLDGIRVRPVEDATAALAQVADGSLHVARLSPSQALDVAQGLQWGTPELQEPEDKARVEVVLNAPRNLVGLVTISFLNDALALDTRRAIAASLDRAEIASHDPQSLVQSKRFLMATLLGYDDAVDVPRTKPRKGKIPIGKKRFEVAVSAADEGLREAIEEQLQSVLKAEVVATALPRDEVRAAFTARRFDAVVTETVVAAAALEPYPYLTDLAATASELMSDDKRLDALRAEVLAETRRERRAELFTQLEQRLIETARVVPLGLWPASRPTDVFLAARNQVTLANPSRRVSAPRPWSLVQLIRISTARE